MFTLMCLCVGTNICRQCSFSLFRSRGQKKTWNYFEECALQRAKHINRTSSNISFCFVLFLFSSGFICFFLLSTSLPRSVSSLRSVIQFQIYFCYIFIELNERKNTRVTNAHQIYKDHPVEQTIWTEIWISFLLYL